MSSAQLPIVIAHRGASAYAPEHTLPAKALAYAMGADYLEQDVVATRDDELVVLHDIHLDRISDVAQRYPDRARDDGRFYVRDFDLAEIRRLRVTERLQQDGLPVYPGRFPPHTGRLRIHTLAEELEFVAGLNKASGRNTGVYPEIKRPAWHRQNGIDITPPFLSLLEAFGYSGRSDPIFVQCFDALELQRIRHDLGCGMRLVQLIAENDWRESDTDYTQLRTAEGLAELARTVDGVGPWISHLYEPQFVDGHPVSTGFAASARKAGLLVHPYTFRADDLPAGFTSFEQLIIYFCEELQVDGVFTDFPDRACRALRVTADPG